MNTSGASNPPSLPAFLLQVENAVRSHLNKEEFMGKARCLYFTKRLLEISGGLNCERLNVNKLTDQLKSIHSEIEWYEGVFMKPKADGGKGNVHPSNREVSRSQEVVKSVTQEEVVNKVCLGNINLSQDFHAIANLQNASDFNFYKHLPNFSSFNDDTVANIDVNLLTNADFNTQSTDSGVRDVKNYPSLRNQPKRIAKKQAVLSNYEGDSLTHAVVIASTDTGERKTNRAKRGRLPLKKQRASYVQAVPDLCRGTEPKVSTQEDLFCSSLAECTESQVAKNLRPQRPSASANTNKRKRSAKTRKKGKTAKNITPEALDDNVDVFQVTQESSAPVALGNFKGKRKQQSRNTNNNCSDKLVTFEPVSLETALTDDAEIHFTLHLDEDDAHKSTGRAFVAETQRRNGDMQMETEPGEKNWPSMLDLLDMLNELEVLIANFRVSTVEQLDALTAREEKEVLVIPDQEVVHLWKEDEGGDRVEDDEITFRAGSKLLEDEYKARFAGPTVVDAVGAEEDETRGLPDWRRYLHKYKDDSS